MNIRRLSALALALCAAIVLLVTNVRAVPTDVILRASTAPVVNGNWSVVADATAAGGARLASADKGAAKVTNPLASPSHYFEIAFAAEANTAYRLWIRGIAYRNSYANDSVFVQFSDAVTASGAAVWRIGTTSATEVNLEACGGCGLSGWGWQDNGWGSGVLGPVVRFAQSGTHTMRIQIREDGLSIDQIVLSPDTYLTTAPGAATNDTTILTSTTAPPPSSSLVREPYLQQVFDRSAIIVWASREPGPAHARVAGRDVPAATTRYARAETGLTFDYYQHEATVTGLSPGTAYSYDVFVGNADVNAAPDRFTTAPAPGSGRTTFIAFGDSGTGSPDQRALASHMDDDTFDLSLHSGDIAYGNTGGTGDATYATYQAWFFDIYRNWLRRRPFFPSPGNHDVRAGTDWGRAYLSLFVLPEEAGAGVYPDHAERYYSFDYGPVHFVSLDTEGAFPDASRRAEQLRWLEDDLSSTAQAWKVAYFHRSPYSSGEHGSDTTVRQAFGPLFEKYNVQLVVSGHDHLYERSIPWRTSTDTTRQAVTYIVAGGGGGPTYEVGQSAWTARSLSRHHYLRVTIEGCDATMAAIGTDGTAFDAHTLDGCAQWSDAGPPSVAFTSPAPGASVSGPITVSATASDDVRVEKVDLWIDGQLHAIDTTAPYSFAWDTRTAAAGTHTLELRAYDIDGKRASRSQTVTVGAGVPAGGDVVIWAADIPPSAVEGAWSFVADSTAAGGVRLWSAGSLSKQAVSPAPASYFEATFEAEANVPYHLWLRMKADRNSYSNDSVSVQFDKSVTAAGTATARIGTSSGYTVNLEDGPNAGVHGWGWQDNGYDTFGPHLYFGTGGTQRVRIQVREDGASVDQIVLSPGTYLTRAPGSLADDGTVLAR